jgi:hypothetical protein
MFYDIFSFFFNMPVRARAHAPLGVASRRGRNVENKRTA